MSNTNETPYALGALKDRPDQRDFVMSRIMKEVEIPDVVDYEKRMNPIRNQYQRGACVAFATCAVKEYQEERQRKFKKELDLSEEWIYGQVRVKGGGSYPRDAFKLLTDSGVCIEKYLPYNNTISDDKQEKPFESTPLANYNARFYKAEAYARLFDSEDMMMSLHVNGPFLLGLMWRKGWFNSTKTFNGYPLLKRGDGSGAGGHAIAIVGYDRKNKVFKLRNSWGEGWGKNGYAYIEMDVVKESFIDAWSTFDIFNPKIDADAVPVVSDELEKATGVNAELVQKVYRISNGNESIEARLTKDHFELANDDGREQFVFMSSADDDTLDRWDRVVDLLKESTSLLRREKLDR